MDSQPNKRRSIFGLATNLFRGSSAPADDSDSKIESPQQNGMNKAQSVLRIDFNSATHESPAKRASDAQLASRKLIGRPQGPSSKLAQSFSSTDFTELSSAPQKKITFQAASATGATRRMPGDNPYKSPAPVTGSKGLVVSGKGAKAASFSGTATSTAPSNIFRAGTPSLYQRPSGTTFAPRIVPGGLNSSLPQTTPGRTSRHSTAELLGAVPVNTELFKMRIPEPPRHLTGEVLAKEVPDDPNRAGSIYADEFLAHYCPPDLDEQQKKQFFCILDLRRLKYAADEIFTKKDWKINILNFAKEYEKSRSLIMLRYGLYEFKTVRASEEVKKEWRQKHGIAESEEEASASSNLRTPAGSKRKAEEELSPIDGALKASTTAGNKRPRAPEPTSPSPIKQKPKRKASMVGSPDEVQPAKLQKASGTPTKASSATKSVFESIVNNTPTATVKKAATGTAKAATTKPALKSVFETAPKPASSGNIFGHLSDSKSSNDDDADSDAETASNVDDDEDEAEAQHVGSASTGVATPQFGLGSQAAVNGGPSASSDAGGSSQSRSIFDRITRGSDGQPIRKPLPQEGKSDLFSATLKEDRPLSTIQEQASSPAPVNNTWNTETPIKFSSGPSNLFGAAASKPAALSNLFGAPAAKKADEPAPSKEATQDSESKSIFGAPSRKADEPVSESPKASTASLFSFGGKTVDTSASTPSLFGTSAPSAPAPAATSSLFGSGASTPIFGQAKDTQESKETTPAPSLFGAKPAESSTIEAPKPSVFQSNTLFGSAPAASEPSKTQPASMFSKPTSAETQATQAPASSMFGASASKPATSSLFDAASASGADEPAAKKFAFGSTEPKPAASTFNFGSTTPAPDAAKPETKSLFGTTNGATPATETKNIFGSSTTPAPVTEVKSLFGGTGSAAPATQPTNLFGNTSAPATETKNLFGNATTPAAETKNLFGNSSTTAPAETKSLFGNTTTSSTPSDSKPLFGASTSQPEASKPLFGAPSSQLETSKPLFGATSSQPESSKPASIFGNNNLAPAPVPASSSFTFGSTAAPATTQPAPVAASSFSFGSGSPAHTPQPGGSFSFGVTPASQPSQPEQNGNMFGANTSFTFSAAGKDASAINNPFAAGGAATPTSSSFTFGQTGGTSAPFVFGQNSQNSQNTPSITFGGSPDSTQQNGSSNMFAFGGQQPSGGGSMFNLAPPLGGTSTGTGKLRPRPRRRF